MWTARCGLAIRQKHAGYAAAVMVKPPSVRVVATTKPAVTRNGIFPIKMYIIRVFNEGMGTAPAPAPPTQKVLVPLQARTRGRSTSETGKTSSVEGCPRERQLSGRAQGNTRHVTRVCLTRDGPRARARRCRARIMRYIDAIL